MTYRIKIFGSWPRQCRRSATPAVNDPRKISGIQPSLLVHDNDRLQAMGRSKGGSVFEVISNNGGRTWGEMTLTSLPNPDSAIDAMTLADGRHLIVYEHSTSDRSPLNVAISADGKEAGRIGT